MMTELEKAFKLKMQLDLLRPINNELESIIMQKFRLEWNYNSNNIEGNTLTYGETKALILFGITAQGKPLQDHFEMVGHDEAVKWVIDVVKGDYPLNENFIRELHTVILKEPREIPAITPDGTPTRKKVEIGKYKTQPNHVLTKTGEIFRFATPEETAPQMDDLIKWYRESSEKNALDPIILASEFHYKFIRIHPFDDGNGRTARILMNFILMKNGYPPVIIKTEDKENYYSVLRIADSGSIEPFIEFISKNLINSLEIMISGAEGGNIEDPNDLDKEIAILQRRLKSIQKSGKVISHDNILHFYNNSYRRLITSFYTACAKFDIFYEDHILHISVGGRGEAGELDILDKAKEFINPNVKDLVAQYQFIGFKDVAINIPNHLSVIAIRFTVNNIEIRTSESGTEKNIRFYDEDMSEKDIRSIIKPVIDAHKKLIDDKLDEIENSDKVKVNFNFLIGMWLNEWDINGERPGSEELQIKEDGSYIRNDEHIFNIEDFKYIKQSNQISFYKQSVRETDNRRVKNVLNIINDDLLTGKESNYFIRYTRIK